MSVRMARRRHPVATGFMPGEEVKGGRGSKGEGRNQTNPTDPSDSPSVVLAEEGRSSGRAGSPAVSSSNCRAGRKPPSRQPSDQGIRRRKSAHDFINIDGQDEQDSRRMRAFGRVRAITAFDRDPGPDSDRETENREPKPRAVRGRRTPWPGLPLKPA
jgi:hypothetical protein